MKTIQAKTWQDIPVGFSGFAEWDDGSKEWFQNGLTHRSDGPALVWPDGSKFWYQNGELHRLGGAAIEIFDREKEYRILDEELTKEEFEIFQGMWERTLLDKTEELMRTFVKLIKVK